MAYSGRHMSLKTAMEEIYRDSGYEYIDWDDVVAWTFRLMGKIGVPSQYITKITSGQDDQEPPIEITNYRGVVPNNVIQRGTCRRILFDNNGNVTRFYPMVEATDLFFQNPVRSTESYPTVTDPEFNTVYIDENGETQRVTVTQETNFPYGSNMYTYKIEGNVMFTNFESGYVEMEYKGFAVDEEGFPMFPEDSKYLEAVVANVTWNLDRKRYRANPSPQNKQIMNDSAQERAWAVGAAITLGRIPSIDEMESIKNSWLRSIPKVNEHTNAFRSIAYPEQRWTHNRRLWQTKTRY